MKSFCLSLNLQLISTSYLRTTTRQEKYIIYKLKYKKSGHRAVNVCFSNNKHKEEYQCRLCQE